MAVIPISVRQLDDSHERIIIAHDTCSVSLPRRILHQHNVAWGKVPYLTITHRYFTLACKDGEYERTGDIVGSWRWLRKSNLLPVKSLPS